MTLTFWSAGGKLPSPASTGMPAFEATMLCGEGGMRGRVRDEAATSPSAPVRSNPSKIMAPTLAPASQAPRGDALRGSCISNP
jgi:hypothetical protein